nr:unnamed protein product [Callosobruchus chinensis]
MGKFTGKKCRLLSMLALTAFYFFVEIVVGYITNSMALIADSFHMLSDVAALIVAFLSVKGYHSINVQATCNADEWFTSVDATWPGSIHDSRTWSNSNIFLSWQRRLNTLRLGDEGYGIAPWLLVPFRNPNTPAEHAYNNLFTKERMSPKKWSKNTFGWARAEVLGALVNAVFLVALCFSITVEACKRFIEIEVIHDPQLLVGVGAIGLLVNLIGLLILHGDRNRLTQLAVTDDNENDETYPSPPPPSSKEAAALTQGHGHSHGEPKRVHSAGEMNMRGVFLHVLSDALGSVIVIISALYKVYIDPALSIVLVLLILHSVWPLLRDSALILLQTVPTHIQVDAIQTRLLENVEGVCRNLSEYMKIAEKVKEFFHNEGIHSTTIQPEFVDYTDLPMNSIEQRNDASDDCFLDCPKPESSDDNCVRNTCCGPSKQGRDTPSPNTTPYVCRQRNSVASSHGHLGGGSCGEEMNEMEKGVLLERSPSCSNGGAQMPATSNGDCDCSLRGSQYSLRK